MEKDLEETNKNLEAVADSIADMYKEFDKRMTVLEQELLKLLQQVCTHAYGDAYEQDKHGITFCSLCGYEPTMPEHDAMPGGEDNPNAMI